MCDDFVRLAALLIDIAILTDSSHAQGSLENVGDTVGQPPRTEIGVPNMPSLKAKKLRKLPREKVLLEL
jgi:hypothetical protein